MIRIKVERRADQSVRAFTVDGHANFAEPGEDIVCAGVSTVTVGTVNAVEATLGIELEAAMDKGLLDVRIPKLPESGVNERLQLLLESMLVMLETIRDQYGEYVEIEDELPPFRARRS